MEKNGNERSNLDDGKLNESEENLDNQATKEPSEELTEDKPLNDDSISESTDISHQVGADKQEDRSDQDPVPENANHPETDEEINPIAEEKNIDTIPEKDSSDIPGDKGEIELSVEENKPHEVIPLSETSAEKLAEKEKNTKVEVFTEEVAKSESKDIAPIEVVPKEEIGLAGVDVEKKSTEIESADEDGEKGGSTDETKEVSVVEAGEAAEEEPEEKQDETVSNEEAHEEEEAHLDYSNYTKKQMVQVLESLLKEDDFSQVGRILKEIKKPYDLLAQKERKSAYDRYIEDGGEKDGFEFRPDELDQRFNLAYGKLKERKNQYYNSLEKQKEHNLNLKLEILEKIRELVDSEETGASIKVLKDLQVQWKEVGVIPSSQVKSLWANYNALLDRFYDQRSIYFELKELDRKKNYDLKIELCERAEQLSEQENIREVIKHLNELHEEFKHLGPVPKEEQELVWERFKAASDKIYSRRKDYYEKLKDELKVNEVAKEVLVEKLISFSDFASDRISDWNAKTKEIIAIQKEWEAIGSLPKEKAKQINKQFWSSFKSFFNKKGQFFKKIEEERRANLILKQELVVKAEELKDSDDFRKTSDELKKLQREWKDVGPVPEKFRNEVFFKFKKACDHFFERRRANSGKIEKDYEENLLKKQKICEELEKMLSDDKIEIERIKAVEKEWGAIGFVPKNSIKSIQNRFTDIVGKIADKIDLPEAEKHKLRFTAQFSNINYGPGAEKMLYKKEGALRRQITTLENDISVWKNNMDFFASSKNADKLKEDFQVKIDKANAQLTSLKEQLKILSNI